MSEIRYIISDAAKMVDVEPHVLRYWEEELDMEIPRNEMGHRYYTDKEIKLFVSVRDLKEKGFQLKAIKMILLTLSEEGDGDNIISLDEVRQAIQEDEVVKEEAVAKEETTLLVETKEEKVLEELSSEEKLQHFKYIMDSIVMDALQKNNVELEDRLSHKITDKVIKEMDYLFRVQEEKEEQRFKMIDEAIRKKQRGRKEVAATQIGTYDKPQKKRGLFRRKNKI